MRALRNHSGQSLGDHILTAEQSFLTLWCTASRRGGSPHANAAFSFLVCSRELAGAVHAA